MENYKEQLAHLQEMRSIMERSSRFFSLSGISGVLVGIYALVAAAVAYSLIYLQPGHPADGFGRVWQSPDMYANRMMYFENTDWLLMLLGFVTLIVSLITILYFSKQKAKKSGENLWNASSKLFLWNLFLPLFVGGLFGLICIYKGWFGLVGPITLMFYGLALINASKFTFGDIQLLGIMECLLGLASLFNLGYGLIFWAIGFGVLHIVYGIIIHYKYERQK